MKILSSASGKYPGDRRHKNIRLRKDNAFIKEYNEEIIRLRCWECDYWFLCPVCYVHAAQGDKIEIQCERSRNDILLLLVQDLKNKERQNETRLDNNSFTVSDYIEGL